MKNIAVIEDDPAAAERLVGFINEYGEKSGHEFNVFVFPGAIKFLENYTAKYDIVFMDIELPDMDGMTASHRLREMDKEVMLIFVTNMAQCAVSGYEVGAFSFIVKPVSYNDFGLKFARALEKLENNVDTTILIPGKTGARRISTSRLKYIEIQSHVIIWHTTDGEIRSTGTLKSIQPQLGPSFVRCNQCYLANLKFCTEISGDVAVVGGDRLHISRPKRAEFVRALNLYVNGMK